MKPQKPERTVELPFDRYQPSKSELEEKVRINAMPQHLAKAIVQPVNIVRRQISQPGH